MQDASTLCIYQSNNKKNVNFKSKHIELSDIYVVSSLLIVNNEQ